MMLSTKVSAKKKKLKQSIWFLIFGHPVPLLIEIVLFHLSLSYPVF